MRTIALGGFRSLLLVSLTPLLVAAPCLGGDDPNLCDMADDAPDVIVGAIQQKVRFGAVGDITAFSLGTVSCNIGTCWMNFFADPSNLHAVTAQHMYRLADGRFEQIGQSWVAHGFFALSQNQCHIDCIPTNGQHLGVHCSNPDSASINGYQPGLGPKFEVDPGLGSHPHPFTGVNQSGDAIYKRLQVHHDDLDPELNSGARYFVEAQFVAADDAHAGNQNNNASYREVEVFGSGGVFDFVLLGPTAPQEPAISAWATHDPAVALETVDVEDDGRFIVGSKVTDLGGGVWHYEYAVHNLSSRRAAMSFGVPIPFGASPGAIGFHDVDYHSGEPFDGTDWTVDVEDTTLSWHGEPYATNPDANALRWGTLYNFRFELSSPPVAGTVRLGLFLPGVPEDVLVATQVPDLCNANGTCEVGEGCTCAADCPGEGADGDGDLVGLCADCNDADADLWSAPGPVQGLMLDHDLLLDLTTLSWSPPDEPGASLLTYEALRSADPADFAGPATDCLLSPTPADTWLGDNRPVEPGGLIAYLVRAVNGCPASGSLGTDSGGVARAGRACP